MTAVARDNGQWKLTRLLRDTHAKYSAKTQSMSNLE